MLRRSWYHQMRSMPSALLGSGPSTSCTSKPLTALMHGTKTSTGLRPKRSVAWAGSRHTPLDQPALYKTYVGGPQTTQGRRSDWGAGATRTPAATRTIVNSGATTIPIPPVVNENSVPQPAAALSASLDWLHASPWHTEGVRCGVKSSISQPCFAAYVSDQVAAISHLLDVESLTRQLAQQQHGGRKRRSRRGVEDEIKQHYHGHATPLDGAPAGLSGHRADTRQRHLCHGFRAGEELLLLLLRLCYACARAPWRVHAAGGSSSSRQQRLMCGHHCCFRVTTASTAAPAASSTRQC
jgi:hypothetical protein